MSPGLATDPASRKTASRGRDQHGPADRAPVAVGIAARPGLESYARRDRRAARTWQGAMLCCLGIILAAPGSLATGMAELPDVVSLAVFLAGLSLIGVSGQFEPDA